jgi:hypothetical protein
VKLLLAGLVAIMALSLPTVAAAQPAPQVVEVSLPPRVEPGQDVTFTVRAVNSGQAAARGSISVSLPDQESVSIVDSTPVRTRGSSAKINLPGEGIFNFDQNQNVPARYPLAELYLEETWAPGVEHYLTLRVSVPTNRTTLAVQARVTLRNASGTFFNFPVGGPPDQQGFPVEVHLVPIAAATVPPTMTPVPTRTPVPTVTSTPSPSPSPSPTPTGVPSPSPSPSPTSTGMPAVGGLANDSNPVAGAVTPTPTPSSDGSSTTVLLVALLLAVTAIAIGAVALTRRPARAPQLTAPWGGGSSYPPPPGGGSFPPAPSWPSHPSNPSYPQPGSFPPPSYPPPGQAQASAIPGGYQIVGTPKHGGMATVYKAFQPSLHRHVALKVLSPSLGSDPSFLERFQGEARWTARLEHPHIVPIYDMGQANGSVFIVMRFIDGLNLQEVLARDIRLPLGRAIAIAAQVADALDYAHRQGFVHRDVKPANILVEPGDRVTLTDFGIAKVVGETRLTRTGAIVGTPEYLSPEQARGDPVDGRADLYALGIVVYEMLAGRPPFQAENPLSVVHAHLMTAPPPPTLFNPGIPPAISSILVRVLAKDPGQRYPTGQAFIQALRQASGT